MPVTSPLRQERRTQQQEATLASRRRQTADRARRSRRRRLVAVGLGAAAVAGAVVGTVVALSVGPAGPAPLTLHLLARASAVSSVAEGLGSGWLADDRSDTLVRFDPTTGESIGAPLKLSGRPVAVTIAFGRVWVASMLSDTVQEVRPGKGRSSGTVVRTVEVPEGPSGLVALDSRLWVSSVVAGDVTALDPTTGSVVAKAHLPQGAVRIAAGAGRVWVTGSAHTVAAVDPQPSAGRLHWRTVTVGRGPLGVAVGDGAVWVANATAGTVSEIDPSTYRMVHTFEAGPDPVAVAVSGGRTLVADGRTDQLRALGTGGRSAPVTLGGTPRQLVGAPSASPTIWAAVGNPGAVLSVR